jgi:peptidoglycan/xylan/chitin deacetylase (PgdA/CDA1 family)/SAM-dependent methyltransferase/uncharacterized protein (DUF2062 family)
VYLLLLFYDPRLAPLPLLAFILACLVAPFLTRVSFYLPIVSRGKKGERGISLTFDDGPDPRVTPPLLDLLERHSLTATFFVTGKNAERYPEIVREILSRGHSVGNHSCNHMPFLMLKGIKTLKAEVESAQTMLARFGIVPLAFRPPVGITNPNLRRVLLELGMFCVNFSCRPSDMSNRRIRNLAARVVGKVAPGDIVLLHDVAPKRGSVESLLEEFDALFRGLKAKGTEVVPLSRLIGRDVMQRTDAAPEPNAAALFYDVLADGYDREQFHSSVSISRRMELALFSARLPGLFAGADRVIEIGAGTGIFTLAIARHCREAVAVDISGNMLRILERKAAKEGISNIRTLTGNAETMELPGMFSAACAFLSLEYIADLPALFMRLAPHIEPGGTLYFIIARRSFFRFFTQVGNAVRQGLWLKSRSRKEIDAMLSAAGFEDIGITSHLLKTWISGGMLLEVVARKKAPRAEPDSHLAKTLIVIPVYNQTRSLRAVVEASIEAGFPVLVIDDGSTDGSLDTVAGLPIERHRFPTIRGKGAAILAGAALAKRSGFEAILTIDADGRHDPADARRLLEASASSWPALVVGARRMESSDATRSSETGGYLSNFWVRLECGQALPDSRSGYRLYPVDLLSAMRFLSTSFAFEVEVLVRAAWAGYTIVSVPVPVRHPPAGERVSNFHRLKDKARLTCLHTWLVTRSLIPWPHRRLVRSKVADGDSPGLLQPLRLLRHLSREHTSAVELAAAVWVGIFVGSLPIIPFGIAAIVYVNHKLHLNKLAGVAASNVCVAPFVPFACMETGHFLLYGRFLSEFNWHTLLGEIHHRLWEWLLGALLIGPLLGLLGALLTYFLVRALRARKA